MIDDTANANQEQGSSEAADKPSELRRGRVEARSESFHTSTGECPDAVKDRLSDQLGFPALVALSGLFLHLTGLIMFVQLHSRFGMYAYIAGVCFVTYGTVFKVADVYRTIIWGGRK